MAIIEIENNAYTIKLHKLNQCFFFWQTSINLLANSIDLDSAQDMMDGDPPALVSVLLAGGARCAGGNAATGTEACDF